MLSQNMSDETTNGAGIQLSGVQVALGWNRPDFAEKLFNSDTATKDEKALGSILMHALVSSILGFFPYQKLGSDYLEIEPRVT